MAVRRCSLLSFYPQEKMRFEAGGLLLHPPIIK